MQTNNIKQDQNLGTYISLSHQNKLKIIILKGLNLVYAQSIFTQIHTLSYIIIYFQIINLRQIIINTAMSIFRNFYLIVILISILPADYLYIFDWPQSLSTKLQEKPYQLQLQKIDLLYTFTSVGVLLMIFKLGDLYDKVSLKITIIIVPTILCITQICTFLMFVYYHDWSYYVITIVRVIFGISGESLFLLQAILCTKIHKKRAGRYIGLGLGIANLGMPLSSLLTPVLVTISGDILLPLFVGLCVTIFYIGVGIIIRLILIQQDKIQQEKLLETQDTADKSITSPSTSTTLFQQVKNLSLEFWILWLLIFSELIFIGGFASVSTDYFHKRFNTPYQFSGIFTLIPLVIGSFTSLFFWNRINISLRNSYIILSLTVLIPHLTYYLLPNLTQDQQTPTYNYALIIILQIILGMNAGIDFANLVPAVYMITNPENSGAITGLIGMAIHLSTLMIPAISAAIVSAFDSQIVGYRNLSLIMYTSVGILSLVGTITIRFSKRFEQLDKSSKQKLRKKSEDSEQDIINTIN